MSFLPQVAIEHHQRRPADQGHSDGRLFRLFLVDEVAGARRREGVPEQAAHLHALARRPAQRASRSGRGLRPKGSFSIRSLDREGLQRPRSRRTCPAPDGTVLRRRSMPLANSVRLLQGWR